MILYFRYKKRCHSKIVNHFRLGSRLQTISSEDPNVLSYRGVVAVAVLVEGSNTYKKGRPELSLSDLIAFHFIIPTTS